MPSEAAEAGRAPAGAPRREDGARARACRDLVGLRRTHGRCGGRATGPETGAKRASTGVIWYLSYDGPAQRLRVPPSCTTFRPRPPWAALGACAPCVGAESLSEQEVRSVGRSREGQTARSRPCSGRDRARPRCVLGPVRPRDASHYRIACALHTRSSARAMHNCTWLQLCFHIRRDASHYRTGTWPASHNRDGCLQDLLTPPHSQPRALRHVTISRTSQK